MTFAVWGSGFCLSPILREAETTERAQRIAAEHSPRLFDAPEGWAVEVEVDDESQLTRWSMEERAIIGWRGVDST